MRVDVEHIEYLQREFAKINAQDFKDLEIYRNGKRIIIDEDTIENWRFVGLNNTTFFDVHRV